jgi:flavin-dependent dehydrogenase
VPPLLSFQVNRFTFDREVRRRNVESGVQMIDDTVAGVDLNDHNSGGGLHTVTLRGSAQEEYALRTRWLVDATGRNRVLSKLLHVHEKVEPQKDVFWFRLMNFSPEILDHIRALKKENRAFVSYFASHHFLAAAIILGALKGPRANRRTIAPSRQVCFLMWQSGLRAPEIRNTSEYEIRRIQPDA